MASATRRTDEPLSELLARIATDVPEGGLSLRTLLERLGERGLLMLAMILTIPFLLPVSIPGSSTPFGLLIAFIAVGVIANRPPWLPRGIMNRTIAKERAAAMLVRGARFFARLEKLAHPRIHALTHGATVGRLNGVLLLVSGIALMAPLPLPLTNTIPAYAVLFLAAGSLERDGLFIVAGYVFVVLEALYFTLVGTLGVAGVRELIERAFG